MIIKFLKIDTLTKSFFRRENQFNRFFVVGLSTVIIDFLLYTLLISQEVDYDFAKTFSFVCGAFFSFFANQKITFKIKKTSFNKILFFILLYVFSMKANVSLNSFILGLGDVDALLIFYGFIISTFVSALINFLGMKFFIFSK